MKKTGGVLVLTLVFALSLFGCSGGSGGGATNSTGPSTGSTGGGGGNNPTAGGGDDTTTSSNTGYLAVNFDGGQTHARAMGSTLPIPDYVRVIVRMIGTVDGYDDEGNLVTTSVTNFKKIIDISVPGSASISLPAGTGYTVDVLSYTGSPVKGTPKLAEKYAQQTGVNITSGQTTPLSIALAPINTTITVPASIASGSAYEVTVSNSVFPIRNDKKNLIAQTSPITTPVTTYSSMNDSFQQTAPNLSVSQTATLYFQGLFFVDPELLDSAADVWSDWVYCYPNSAWGDSADSATVTPPGQVSITITL